MSHFNGCMNIKSLLILIIIFSLVICNTRRKNMVEDAYYKQVGNPKEYYYSSIFKLSIVNNTNCTLKGLDINNQYEIFDVPPKKSVDVGSIKIGYNGEGSVVLNYSDTSGKRQTEILLGYIGFESNITVYVNEIDEKGRYKISTVCE